MRTSVIDRAERVRTDCVGTLRCDHRPLHTLGGYMYTPAWTDTRNTCCCYSALHDAQTMYALNRPFRLLCRHSVMSAIYRYSATAVWIAVSPVYALVRLSSLLLLLLM